MKNRLLLWVMLFFVCSSIHTISYADDGKSIAFDLAESTPQNSAQNVALDTSIKLIFNKNVVNFSVKDHNSKCFSLLDGNNQIVPIDIIFADDQIEPDKKREIILKPREALKENITYRVEISPQLQAKNGSFLDKKVSFSFTTLALAAEEAITASSVETPTNQAGTVVEPEKAASPVEAPIAKQANAPSSSSSAPAKEMEAKALNAEAEDASSESISAPLVEQEDLRVITDNEKLLVEKKSSTLSRLLPGFAIIAAFLIIKFISKNKKRS